MGDEWDYKLWKAESAWDLAMRIIPDKPSSDQGAWPAKDYLAKSQEILTQSVEVVDTVFKADIKK